MCLSILFGCMCTTCVPSSDRSKGTLDFLELELRMIVSHLGLEPGSPQE